MGVDIKTDLRKMGFRVWIGFMWLRIGTVNGLLKIQLTFGLHKSRGTF
jgi:hypothetical protein